MVYGPVGLVSKLVSRYRAQCEIRHPKAICTILCSGGMGIGELPTLVVHDSVEVTAISKDYPSLQGGPSVMIRLRRW